MLLESGDWGTGNWVKQHHNAIYYKRPCAFYKIFENKDF